MNTAIVSDIAHESTREKILRVAYDEMYEHGFQGLRIDAVLKKTQLAKGALYHYFPTKLALGYAVVDEVVIATFHEMWGERLGTSNNPLIAMKDFFNHKCLEFQSGECANGCPLTNLIQEMSTLDDGFQQRLRGVMLHIVEVVAATLRQGQTDGSVNPEIDASKMAMFLLSSYQGVMSTAKCLQSPEAVKNLFDMLCNFVDSLEGSDIKTVT